MIYLINYYIQAMMHFPFLILSPVILMSTYAILHYNFGYSTLCGYLTIFVIIAVQSTISTIFKRYRYIYIYIRNMINMCILLLI